MKKQQSVVDAPARALKRLVSKNLNLKRIKDEPKPTPDPTIDFEWKRVDGGIVLKKTRAPPSKSVDVPKRSTANVFFDRLAALVVSRVKNREKTSPNLEATLISKFDRKKTIEARIERQSSSFQIISTFEESK